MAATPIQKFALGLLSLLAQKVNGRTPVLLSDTLTPIVNCAPFYGLSDRKSISTGGVVAVEGNVVTIPVPAGEIWRVYAVSVQLRAQVGVTAPDGFGAAAAVDYGGPTVRLAAINTEPRGAAVAAIASYTAAALFPEPLVLSAGHNIHAFNERTYGVAVVDIVLRAFYESFPQ